MAENSNQLKSDEEEDRISDLADNLIQHILSFLPSTKQAIQTGILSKRWHKQWTQVPVLIFNSVGMSRQDFINFVDNSLILHESPKINTFHLRYDCYNAYDNDPNFDEQIRFATTKQVEDLSLSCPGCRRECFLPEFLFNTTSLVKLRTNYFSFNHVIGKVNWVRLKALTLVARRLPEQAIEHVLSGSPSLELLELKVWDRCKFDKLAITTKSLKKLVLDNFCFDILEISCPNLEDLSLKRLKMDDCMLDQAIENVLFKSLLLESLMVECFHWVRLPVIASQSLKRLVMNYIVSNHGVEICCKKLEDFKLLGSSSIMDIKFRNVPHSLCATLDFDTCYSSKEAQKSYIEDIMNQLRHIKELTVGNSMVKMITDFAVGDPPFPLHIKYLIIDRPINHKPLSRILRLLQHFPVLEMFVFKMYFTDPTNDMPDLDGFEEDYWSSNHCLVSHLKRIKLYVILLGGKKPARVLNFIKFLLHNARALDNMTFVLASPFREQNSSEVSKELLGFTPMSKHATVEIISECS